MDTQSRTKPPRIKRTYNLSPDSIEIVKRLAAAPGMEASQDAVVDRAIHELDRHIRNVQDAILWEKAARDTEFVAEMAEIQSFFAALEQRA